MKNSVKIFLLLAVIIILAVIIYRCSRKEENPVSPDNYSVSGLEIPTFESQDQIIKHTAYTLQYNEANEQADWVAYFMTKDRLANIVPRTDDFREDPLVSSGSATLDDYKYSGYDRGHMAPAGDFGWSHTAMSESFFLSNMSPQLHAFNAGIWEVLENQVRSWANAEGDTLFIAAGPILKAGLPVIGARQKLTVPEYFYKALLRKSQSGLSAIAFIFKHEASSKPLSSFAITVDSLEHLTGFNFFSRLSVSLQAYIESRIDYSKWPGITLTKNQLRKKGK